MWPVREQICPLAALGRDDKSSCAYANRRSKIVNRQPESAKRARKVQGQRAGLCDVAEQGYTMLHWQEHARARIGF